MSNAGPIAAALLLSLAGAAIARDDPTPDFGLAPQAGATAMVEQAARQFLKDPDSARFEWPHGFVRGWYRPPFGKKYVGWITCGTVNAKNSLGGYTGRTAIIGVIRDGAVIETNIDETNEWGPGNGSVAIACKKIGVPVF